MRCATTSPASPRTCSAALSIPSCAPVRWLVLATAAAVAAWGLIDVYVIALDWWRTTAPVGTFAISSATRTRRRSRACRRTSSTTTAASRSCCAASSRPSSRRSPPPTLVVVALLLAPRTRAAIPLAALAAAGSAVDIHEGGDRRARGRAGAPRRRVPTHLAARRGGRGRRGRPRVHARSPRGRPADALHAGGARVAARQRATRGQRRTSYEPLGRATTASLAKVSKQSSTIRRGTASATPARSPSARASTSRPASRTTRRSASRRGCSGRSCSSPGT